MLDAVAGRIRALLNKTTENGCTESEALLAAVKARELIAAAGTMTDRYRAIKGSRLGFDATVVDITKPIIIGGKHYQNQFEPICECFDIETANKIAELLNGITR